MIDRDDDPDPLFCRRSLLVRPDGSAVDHRYVMVMGGSDGVHHPIPHTRFPPSHEAVVRVSAWAITLGQIIRKQPGVWKYTGVAAGVRPRRRPDRLGDVGPASPAIELEGDQLGEFGRDVCHRIFCSTQAASRAEQRADFAESFVRRVVHDGNEQVTR